MVVTVTSTTPAVRAGLVAVIWVAVSLIIVAAVVPKSTERALPRFDPLMVTDVPPPSEPDEGEIDVTTGSAGGVVVVVVAGTVVVVVGGTVVVVVGGTVVVVVGGTVVVVVGTVPPTSKEPEVAELSPTSLVARTRTS